MLRPPSIYFRDAALFDVMTVLELVQSAYRGEASRVGWTTEADLLDGGRTDASILRAEIITARSVIVLAYKRETEERPFTVGHLETGTADAADELLACFQLRDEGRGSAYFGMFAVRPYRQGVGIGRVVLAEAERRAVTDWQCSVLRMLVIRQRDDLIAWYKRLGFALTGKTSPFPYGDERFGRPKRPDLEFVELAKPLPRRFQ